MRYKKVYRKAFSVERYSSDPTALNYQLPLDFIVEHQASIESVIDVSSGRGHLLKKLQDEFDFYLLSTDLEKFNDLDVDFIQANLIESNDLRKFKTMRFDVLTCLDVLEHIEEQYIDSVLEALSEVADHTLFTIANHSDVWNGVELHLIRKGINYWSAKLAKYFDIRFQESFKKNRLFYFELGKKKT